MARKKIATQADLKSTLMDWAQSPTNREDELIILQGEIDVKDAQIDAFKTNDMVIKIQPDATDPFHKITFVELLA